MHNSMVHYVLRQPYNIYVMYRYYNILYWIPFGADWAVAEKKIHQALHIDSSGCKMIFILLK